ncbi:DNA utilization protein HofM [Yokenella regensburgei]|uniref:DNA utilization protein HofM n=1 Tax=Yokenella regensburgei TaxID=158877 RepID=UPI003F13700E
MAFGQWQIGLHIQQDSIVSVALTPGRAGWTLRRWWQIPLPAGTMDAGQLSLPQQLIKVLAPWRKSLPQRHRIRLAFPAARTLQKRVPRPAMTLRESELSHWLSHTVSRELAMSAGDLRFDYTEDTLATAYSVTAVQTKEIAELLNLTTALRLNVAAVTPDACALQQLIPFLSPPARCLLWREASQWLWATRGEWGRHACEASVPLSQVASRLGIAEEEVIQCADEKGGFDPWSAVTQRHPPLPSQGACFAVAIGLALGSVL